jgi:hypothetical protein
LSASAFARQQGLNYTTFCGWRQRQGQAGVSPGFVQIQLAEPEAAVAAVELVIELGSAARLRLTSREQLPLAAHLLQALNAPSPC